MYITDLNGEHIQVTDRMKAITQAEAFVTYQHEDATLAARDKELHEYWQDILNKLQSIATPIS